MIKLKKIPKEKIRKEDTRKAEIDPHEVKLCQNLYGNRICRFEIQYLCK